MIELTRVERTALRGMEALMRELHARHAQELRQHGIEMLDVMADIAGAHDLPRDAFFNGWGISADATTIVRTDGTSPPGAVA